MIRMIINFLLSLAANAIGLVAASYFLPGFSIDYSSFIIAVLIFSITTTLLGPFIIKVALTQASFLMGGIALVTTFVGLLITSLISSGIMIEGVSTWILATLVVWIFSVIGNVILPFIVFKKILDKNKGTKS